MSIIFSFIPVPAESRLAFGTWFYHQFTLGDKLGLFHEASNAVIPAEATATHTLDDDLHTPQLLDLLRMLTTSRDFFLTRPQRNFDSPDLKSEAVENWKRQYCELYHLLMPSIMLLTSEVNALLQEDFAMTGREEIVRRSHGTEGGMPGDVEREQLAKLALIDRMNRAFYECFEDWRDVKHQVELAAEQSKLKVAPAGIQERILTWIGVISLTPPPNLAHQGNYLFPGKLRYPDDSSRRVNNMQLAEHPIQPRSLNGMSRQGVSESNI